jgi:CHAT domain-containing protein
LRRSKRAVGKPAFVALEKLTDETSLQRFLAANKKTVRARQLRQLIKSSHSQLRVDPRAALAIAELAISIARRIRHKHCLGSSLRAKANALYMLGDNRAALDLHGQALRIFRSLQAPREIARTANASVQPFILLGEYENALKAATRAKRLFKRLRDKRRLAHAEINLGNIYHRQDRFEEALSCYKRAYSTLAALADGEGLAVALNNMSVCLVSLNDFRRALAAYKRARNLSARHGMTLLSTQTDYNIAYLYYLRGEYGRSIELLRAIREQSGNTGDSHILALCYLDLSEIYLELNLSKEAIQTAQRAGRRFRALGMGYETAKAITNEAVALGQQGQSNRALELFVEARAVFIREQNLVWPSLIDLHRAIVLSREGRLAEAQRLCVEALSFFENSPLTAKAVLCRLLLGSLELQKGEIARAQEHATAAFKQMSGLQLPTLNFQAHFLLGQIQSRTGDVRSAYESFQTARHSLEDLRTTLHKDELKVAFLKDKYEVYEALVALCLKEAHPDATVAKAFEMMELAKSRGLVDLILQNERASSQAPKTHGSVSQLRDLRDQINWYHRRIELEQVRPRANSSAQLKQLKDEAAKLEDAFLSLFRDQPSALPATRPSLPVASLDTKAIQASLGTSTSLLEYFSVGDTIVVVVVNEDEMQVVPVSAKTRVEKLLQALQLQLSKFRLGKQYVQEFELQLLQSVQGRLGELYKELIGPVRQFLRGEHLVVVPHGILHHLPYHALYNGQSHLIERFTVSYAPSASIYALCRTRSGSFDSSLVLGIPDSAAPLIRDEINAVSKILPRPQVYLGKQATEQVLRERGPTSQIVHIATHGNFRQDNPSFSAIKLGRSYLNLCDLYQMELPVDLVTLSGCGTGLNVVTQGDEHLGLMRGFLSAGARSLLLTLWDVNDRSTADFMTSFYTALQAGEPKAQAFRRATLQTRDRFPHPYFWAPFILVGNAS